MKYITSLLEIKKLFRPKSVPALKDKPQGPTDKNHRASRQYSEHILKYRRQDQLNGERDP